MESNIWLNNNPKLGFARCIQQKVCTHLYGCVAIRTHNQTTDTNVCKFDVCHKEITWSVIINICTPLISDKNRCYRAKKRAPPQFFQEMVDRLPYLTLAWLQFHARRINNKGGCCTVLLETEADIRLQGRSVTDHDLFHVFRIFAFLVPISSLACQKR